MDFAKEKENLNKQLQEKVQLINQLTQQTSQLEQQRNQESQEALKLQAKIELCDKALKDGK